MNRIALALLAVALAGCTTSRPYTAEIPDRGLVVATWNMEHLAEADGSGCRPRVEADYADMRVYTAALNADVIAFQEVESKAAAERVFDPLVWTVIIEDRVGSGRHGFCRGEDGQTINTQRTGFAIRKQIPFDRQPDFTALQTANADLRSGVDVIVRPRIGPPVRLLSVHLKSGCSSGESAGACPVLFQQAPVLETWIDQRAGEGVRFAILGDFNRRLARSGDALLTDWNDAEPAGADLVLAGAGTTPACDPRYSEFIDHIVLDRRASLGASEFREAVFPEIRHSDHCAITVRLLQRPTMP